MRKNVFLLIIMVLVLTSCATNRASDSQWTYSHHEGDLKESNDIRYYFIDEKYFVSLYAFPELFQVTNDNRTMLKVVVSVYDFFYSINLKFHLLLSSVY